MLHTWTEHFATQRSAERHASMRASAATGYTGTIRSDGDLLVVPVIALVESAIHAINADHPEYVPATALARTVTSWRARPVTYGHPQRDGKQISADAPGIRDAMQIGTILDATINRNRLCMTVALDPAKAEAIGAGHLIARLRNGESAEVSVGAFVTTINTPGTFNGRSYAAIWDQITPDHLAVIPRGGKGACSYDDGCGINRAAASPVHTEPTRGHTMNENQPLDGYAIGLRERRNAELRAAGISTQEQYQADKAVERAEARALESMADFRSSVYNIRMTARDAAQNPITDSEVFSNPPDPYEAGLEKMRRREELRS